MKVQLFSLQNTQFQNTYLNKKALSSKKSQRIGPPYSSSGKVVDGLHLLQLNKITISQKSYLNSIKVHRATSTHLRRNNWTPDFYNSIVEPFSRLTEEFKYLKLPEIGSYEESYKTLREITAEAVSSGKYNPLEIMSRFKELFPCDFDKRITQAIKWAEREQVILQAVINASHTREQNSIWGEHLTPILNILDSRHPNLQQKLEDLKYWMVITIHPTELIRTVISSKCLAISQALREGCSSSSKRVQDELTLLARTSMQNPEKTKPEHELQRVIDRMQKVIIPTIPEQVFDLRIEAQRRGLKPGNIQPYKFSVWWDMDGHPYITPEHGSQFAAELHQIINDFYFERIGHVGERLSGLGVYEKLEYAKDRMFGAEHGYISKNDLEELKRNLNLSKFVTDQLNKRIQSVNENSLTTIQTLPEDIGFYKLYELLNQGFQSYSDNGIITESELLALRKLEELNIALDVFGSHCASIDNRQNRKDLEFAMGYLCEQLQLCETPFQYLSPEEKQEILSKSYHEKKQSIDIESILTLLSDSQKDLDKRVHRVLSTLKKMKDLSMKYGSQVIGSLVISNAASEIDSLTALTLLNLCSNGEMDWCDIPIVQLRESTEDLKNGSKVKESLSKIPMYLEHEKRVQQERGFWGEIDMFGHSDARKDGGQLSGPWNIFSAERDINNIHPEEVQVSFHGTGGSPERGGGYTLPFWIACLDPGSIKRFTRQGGEVFRFMGDPEVCKSTLGRELAAILNNSLYPENVEMSPEDRDLTVQILQESEQMYKEVLKDPLYLEMAQSLYKAYKGLNQWSRPAGRTDRLVSLDKLRAISFHAVNYLMNLSIGAYSTGEILSKYKGQIKGLYQRSQFWKSAISSLAIYYSKFDLDTTEYLAANEKYGKFCSKQIDCARKASAAIKDIISTQENSSYLQQVIELNKLHRLTSLPAQTIIRYLVLDSWSNGTDNTNKIRESIQASLNLGL
ncbi:MAG: phosphoenolpyruvate carboxylase [Candidatus Caenarcaniphilales bacterium]|nr:phosphoenolpyruvate carboxylase [Candidatus Caenarcaniphilales bacterium]